VPASPAAARGRSSNPASRSSVAAAPSSARIVVAGPDVEAQRRPVPAQPGDGGPGRPVGRPEAEPQPPRLADGPLSRLRAPAAPPRAAAARWCPSWPRATAALPGGRARAEQRLRHGQSRCRSSGHEPPPPRPARADTRSRRRSTASRSWPARMRAPCRLMERGPAPRATRPGGGTSPPPPAQVVRPGDRPGPAAACRNRVTSRRRR
jgi:hypothetical protein